MAEERPTVPAVPGRAATAKPDEASADARFEHVREIARGGMGRVVEAHDRRLGRTVALKESLADHADARLRFEREVAITARLEHPSIVPLYDAGTADDGTPFYVMRKVSGAPLDELIRRATTLDKRLRLLPHLLAVADAVAHAHQRGIIHRDLKPTNVLVGEHGETIVIDWGLAKRIDEDDIRDAASASHAPEQQLTTAGAIVGTPGFMSPEQVAAGKLDERSDVYALGACLYYLLAGRTPHPGSTEDEILARTTEGSIESLSELVRGIAPDLLTIVNKALAHDPRARYLDAGGFAEDLRRFLGGQLVASHHYPFAQRALRWVRRHRAVVAAALIGIAVAVSIAVVSVRRILDEQRRTRAALALERERADELVIAQATALLPTDPTRVLAMLQQLPADSPRWRELGPLLADVRSRGIARALPGGSRFDIVRFSAREPRVLVSGNGIVRLHDLARGTSTIVGRGDHLLRGDWCGSLIALHGGPLLQPRLVDPDSGASQDIAWSAPVMRGAAGAGVLAWIDNQRRVATLDVTRLPVDAKPTLLPGAVAGHFVDVTPSGRFLVVTGEQRTQVFARDGGWKLVLELPSQRVSYAFDASESRIALVAREQADYVVVEYALPAGRELRRWRTPTATAITYNDRDPVVLRDTDVVRLAAGGEIYPITRSEVSSPLGLYGSRPGTVAVLVGARRVLVKRASFTRAINAPLDLYGIALAPDGRFLLGLSAGTLLAWDLADIVPEQVDIVAGETIAFRNPTKLVTSYVDHQRGVRRVDVLELAPPFTVTKTVTIGHIPALAEVVVQDNGFIAALSVLEQMLVPFDAELATRRDITAIVADGPDSVLLGARDGSIDRFDIKQHTATRVTTLGRPVAAVARTAGFIAAQADDGTLLRRDASGRETRDRVLDPGYPIAVTRDGTVYALQDRNLVAWPTWGAPRTVAQFEQEAVDLRVVAGERILVRTREGTHHLYEPLFRLTRALATAPQLLVHRTSFASAAGNILALHAQGLGVLDLASGQRWTLADDLSVDALAVSPDGRAIVTSEVRADDTYTLSRFAVSVPEPSLAWVKGATNALPLPLANTAAPLEWRL